jgi:Fe-Mn family superoxide dismutase
MSIVEEAVLRSIEKNLGTLNEDYNVKSKTFMLKTDLLTEKSKKLIKVTYEKSTSDLNEVSTLIEGAAKSFKESSHSMFRDLKKDEQRLINQSFLLANFLENIDDQNSTLMMDTMSYMRLVRDWGTFDQWQEDFLATALSSRSGFAITIYSHILKRYMNVCIDNDMSGITIGSSIVVSLCVFDSFYSRDYLENKETYIRAMMKELNWSKVENRILAIEEKAKRKK